MRRVNRAQIPATGDLKRCVTADFEDLPFAVARILNTSGASVTKASIGNVVSADEHYGDQKKS